MTILKFKPKKYEIEGFQFTGIKIKPPQWFKNAYEKGQVMLTVNERQQHITVFNGELASRAEIDDWVCRGPLGNIFVLTKDELETQYEQITITLKKL